jgi:hypothetical protein
VYLIAALLYLDLEEAPERVEPLALIRPRAMELVEKQPACGLVG